MYQTQRPASVFFHRFILSVVCIFVLCISQAAWSVPAKNVILMIGDGQGFNHIQAADYYIGRKQPFESWPVHLAMAHYPGSGSQKPIAPGEPVIARGSYDPAKAWTDFGYVKINPTDSAAAATAMATGVKTYNHAIGMDLYGKRVENISEIAKSLGKSAGVVTSVPWSHATPAGFCAHNIDRNNYAAIAKEIINKSQMDVVMGAGHPDYNNDGRLLKKAGDAQYVGGAATWNALKAGTAGGSNRWTLIQTRAQFRALASGPTPKRVCGTAEVGYTLQQARSGDPATPFATPLNANVPTLAEMTAGALNVLDNNQKGFFLMIEGGAIDLASHANQKGRVIEETMAFNEAVEAVILWVDTHSNWNETLVIVTGDHETGYLTGPDSGQIKGKGPVWNKLVNNGKGKLPGFEWHSNGHTNSLIPIFARGCGAEGFTDCVIGTDRIRGPYVNNIAIFQVIKATFEAPVH